VIVNINVGSAEQAGARPPRIYPNPASGTITIDLGAQQQAQLFLFNAYGACVMQRTVTGSTGTLDISGLPSGVYMVRSMSGEGTFQQHLIKD
jgi:hypothetical protein